MVQYSALSGLLGAILFMFAPGGINAASIGSFLLIIFAIASLFWATSREERATREPLAAELGLEIDSVVELGGSSRVEFSGTIRGHAVKLTIQSHTQRMRLAAFPTTTHSLSVRVPCENPRRIRLEIVPVLPKPDIYLELLPQKLEASWGSEAFEVRGSDEESIKALIQQVGPGKFMVLRAGGRDGDYVSLSGNECSFKTKSKEYPAAERLRRLLDLCVEIAGAAA